MIKIASNNVIDLKKEKEFEEKSAEKKQEIINLTVWSQLNAFLEEHGLLNDIEGGVVILKTVSGDIRSNAINLSESELISTLEETKQRQFYSKFKEYGEIEEDKR